MHDWLQCVFRRCFHEVVQARLDVAADGQKNGRAQGPAEEEALALGKPDLILPEPPRRFAIGGLPV